jgi:ribonuclease HI
MYAALGTRPDIAFAVATPSRYNARPYTTHMTAAKRVLRYLKGTATAKLVFPGNVPPCDQALVGYTDSDWAGDKVDYKSQGGYVFQAYNGPISWQSRKQNLVALSTTEAEYVACSNAVREAQWLIQLHKDVTGEDATPVSIFSDSNGALKTIQSGISTAKTKHINIQYHNSRDLQAQGIVNFSYISTNDNLADIMTKALSTDKHRFFTNGIGIRY